MNFGLSLFAGALALSALASTSSAQVTWTQMNDNVTLQPGLMVACTNGVGATDNGVLRSYLPATHGVSGNFNILSVTIGIEQATAGASQGGSQPAQFRLYSDATPGTIGNVSTLTLLADELHPIPNTTGSPVFVTHTFSTPITFTNTGTNTLVVEFFTPDSIAMVPPINSLLWTAGNANGQTAPTFLYAVGCGIPDPTDTAAIGFPTANVILDVTISQNSGTTYCTAKVNSLGCVPAISGAGLPSATATSGFVISSVNMRNNKVGLLFYTNGGQAATPFTGGTLCVGGALKRVQGLNTGGTPAPVNDCTGIFSVDMNSFRAGLLGGNPNAFLSIPGTVVDSQFWGRDPGFAAPNNTQLSDGLNFTIGA